MPSVNDNFITIQSEKEQLCKIIKDSISQMSILKMHNSEKNEMFKICHNLIENISKLNKHLIIEESGMKPEDAIDSTTNFVSHAISEVQSVYKRDKVFSRNQYYVAPVEKAVGTRMEMIYDKTDQVEKPHLIQSTLQYISPIESLKSFFKNEENRKLYFDFNRNHECVKNVYERFCCGKVFQSNSFFKSNPYAIQLAFSTDEFEVCNPLGSRKGKHKLWPVYFTIKNLPPRLNSKIHNIFLAVVCNSDDLKTEDTDFNDILELLKTDILELQTVGIVLSDQTILKGSIAYFTSDNLGANTVLGLAESFRATFYCRICITPRNICEKQTKENSAEYRIKQNYKDIIRTIENSANPDLKDTFGVKRYCILNDVPYFDIFKNIFADIMHDLSEGVIPLILQQIFLICISSDVFKIDELRKLVSYYKYPKKFRSKKPSHLVVENKNLNQNATQTDCLFLNIPFILYKFKENILVKSMWILVKELLQIYQIVHSEKLDEKILMKLDDLI